MKICKTLLILLTLSLAACGAPIVVTLTATAVQIAKATPTLTVVASRLPSATRPVSTATARPSPSPAPSLTPQPTATPAHIWTLGLSAGGNPIDIYRFGQGPTTIVLIGGIHGGYEWNTILLAYEMIDYFEQSPSEIPSGFSLYIIPAANPDGLATIIGHTGRFSAQELPAGTTAGRFNANGVDLNRNWDCKWQKEAQWQTETISAGSAPFSEPETRLVSDFLTSLPAAAVIWWHSAMPGVFPGGCNDRFPAALALADDYSSGSTYPVQKEFVSYHVTGDASDWLSLQGIPSISVELSTHKDTEFKRNLAGVLSVLQAFVARPTPSVP